ncbi:hydantoinase B/oxoprolinase family protein [Hoeflea prorocentri]|uniref:Hydantoinase B/oxoprolinase family protein n=1 Tax=Hoeflea prorocentri TaxID=1922333 RepID=A0A9X3UFX3_9HYPH|nr:hydantoinase B/oxoprolinase family protein [Hoeflea prorocentri]MCY6379869.1 hydantoinase B/oxoprolinase family protein [Hoeflea prorocentri]MDA5397669.1 hydantoinase B/oxoprolinase family protein [Hoeflea prorocentri]
MAPAPGEDPFTTAVIQASLVAAADEMFAVLRKTAMSPIIYEVLDVGTGITDGEGNLVSSGAGIPTFVGVLDKAVRRILELHGMEAIRPGDLFITNDPYYGGVTHLNDVVLALPVFAEGRLIAWCATIAHWNDIGGRVAGSMSTEATEIFQEGLRLPAVRLFEAGEKVGSVFDIIAANSRLPDFANGDLWAQVAACRIAERRIAQLTQAHGIEAFDAALVSLFEGGEKRGLAGLRDLPQGTYEIQEEQDDGALWRAAITIASDRFTVDLRGNPSMRDAPYNTSRDGAVISAQMIFKALTDPSLFANAGSFRPLQVITEPGTVFHATGNTPHGYYFETRIRLYDMLWQCLARAMPERLPAGHFASICGTVLAGEHPDTGRRYTMVEPQMGGWGATSSRDGLDAMYSCSHGETYNCPVEVAEARYGLGVDYKRLSDGDEGQGRFIGGKGLSVCYSLRGEALLSAGYSRNRIPVWGLAGGQTGGTNGFAIMRGDRTREPRAFASGVELKSGDRIEIDTANGGGWGER